MKYFVTGGTGFIGGALIAQLVKDGHTVVASVRTPSKAGALQALPGVTIVEGDVTNKESMRSGMAGTDGVYHVAAWVKVGATTFKDLAHARAVTVEGTRNVLELVKELNIPKVVVTSSLAVNSNTKGAMVDETYIFTGRHSTVYAQTKAEAHFEVCIPAIKEGSPLVLVMPGVVYGPGAPVEIEDSFSKFLTKKLPAVPSGSAFSWQTVQDAVSGHILAMEKGKVGESYIIAGPRATFMEAIDVCEKLTGIKGPTIHPSPLVLTTVAALLTPISWVVKLPSDIDPAMLRMISGTYIGSDDKAKRELGYAPTPLEEGFKVYLKYLVNKLELPPIATLD